MNKRILKITVIISSLLVALLISLKVIYPVLSDYLFKQQELKSLKENGGAEIVLQVNMSGIATQDKNLIFEESKGIITKRIRLLGFYPFVKPSQNPSDYSIIVQLANVKDLETLVEIIGKTAELKFNELDPATNSESSTGSAVNLNFAKYTGLSGKDLKISQVQFDPDTGKPEVGIEFTSSGAKLFEEITARNVGKPVAIVLDNEIISAPRVNQAVSGGKAVIVGEFTLDEAKNLSIQLNAGSFPAPIKTLEKSYIKSGGQE